MGVAVYGFRGLGFRMVQDVCPVSVLLNVIFSRVGCNISSSVEDEDGCYNSATLPILLLMVVMALVVAVVLVVLVG